MTRASGVVELEPNQMLVVPPDTAHGFRNTGAQRGERACARTAS
jgi:mannose-6-phosphate isomerase-like protein (cupin superfamily)